jgi:3-phenylpropionate/trans-cinnamate dioxygenase beta subunit
MTTAMQSDVSNDEYISICRFLSHEASLLDDRDYRGWLALLDEGIVYQVLAQQHRGANDAPAFYTIIDEESTALRARVEQIATSKLTHAENPPSLVRRVFSTVVVGTTDRANEFHVRSNIMIFRSKPEIAEDGLYVGVRKDILRTAGGRWELTKRVVYLDHSLLRGCVSIIF